MGLPEDADPYAAGIVQVPMQLGPDRTAPRTEDVDALAATLQAFLQQPEARAAIAKAGRLLYESRRASTLMQRAVDDLLVRRGVC